MCPSETSMCILTVQALTGWAVLLLCGCPCAFRVLEYIAACMKALLGCSCEVLASQSCSIPSSTSRSCYDDLVTSGSWHEDLGQGLLQFPERREDLVEIMVKSCQGSLHDPVQVLLGRACGDPCATLSEAFA